MKQGIVVLMGMLMVTGSFARAGFSPLSPASADSQLSSRVAISGGMGVEYLSVPDVVDFINASIAPYTTRRTPEFKSAVQFFGALAYPLSVDWILKGEYVYMLASYDASLPGRSSEFSLTVHMPSLILQYVLWDDRLYNIKAGLGVGYHLASMVVKYLTVDDRLKGNGLGVLLDLEANTAFGDHFFGYLGGDIRWEFIGALKSATSLNPGALSPTVHAFGIGARLGFSYYF